MDKALIDTSILLEPFTQWKNNEPNYKRRCSALLRGELQTFSKLYQPTISLGILGELQLILLKKEAEGKLLISQRDIMLTELDRFFNRCIKIGLTRDTIQLTNEILSQDPRLEPLDALHIATAISEGCKTFIFIDYHLKENVWLHSYIKSKGLHLTPFNIPENRDTKRLTDRDFRF